MDNNGIYLDYNATTPCDPKVVEKMIPYFTEIYGNPSNGLHRLGRAAAKAVDDAREKVATLVGARSKEIIFTAGATESNNLAILGLARSHASAQRKRIVTCAVEHKAVLGPCKKLEEEGFDVVILPVDEGGRVLLDAAKEAINEDTLLVSIQVANNEIGTLQPIQELSKIVHDAGAVFHCDAAQAVGKIPVLVQELGVDMCSISAHKLYGPKGVGALYVDTKVRSSTLEPVLYGGGQENGIRSGTTNVPAIVGFGEACQLANELLPDEALRIRSLRDQLEAGLSERIPDIVINGRSHDRLTNTSSITFQGIDADALIFNLRSVMIGTGSACSSGAIGPSHVLQAMGLTREAAFSTVRVSCGRFSSANAIQDAICDIEQAYLKVK
ncbi:cysteine desulfurase family protein [Levilinea saccharolytica]|uniref:cysteine desulfurase family protein n=1 Tax=Levilinea saccharolytica TaxID=229921 RepID=UPI00094627B0|nr:cysteine desulfurase family protein [Levilinea saccharolytica]GAP17316.1 cysteine desulfurase IscS [Levilinea saccharolytica]